MLKKIILFLFFNTFIINGQNLYTQLDDGTSGITNGYGAWGNFDYTREASIDVQGKGTITFYHPNHINSVLRPTVFFISGWGRTYESYDKFFKYIASLDYNVVNIYNTNPGNIQESYQNSLDMMQQAVQTYSGWIDTTRIGLMGHSYGGGATIWLGKQVFDSNGLNWGANGRFILTFAPWLSFLVADTDLQNYPDGVKLLMIQSNDDLHYGGPNYNTDPRALRAVYQLINIPDDEKDFITLFSDPVHQYTYQGETISYLADHYVSYTGIWNGDYYGFDAFDVYSSNRLADAMLKYVFENDLTAKNVALGNNSPEQKNMGFLPDLEATDYYIVTRPESEYEYKCSATTGWGSPDIWFLHDYCNDDDNDGHIDALSIRKNPVNNFKIFLNPIVNQIVINPDNNQKYNLRIIDISGQIVYQNILNNTVKIDVSKWSKGIYSIYITQQGKNIIKRIIKN